MSELGFFRKYELPPEAFPLSTEKAGDLPAGCRCARRWSGSQWRTVAISLAGKIVYQKRDVPAER